jgi:hypothetical protein
MGREFIGECTPTGDDPEFEDRESEMAVKYIKQVCGQPPEGVDVQITSEGSEVGNNGDEVSYPVISVVWDDSIIEYPDDYIGKCIEAFERFDLPEEIHQRYQLFFQLQDQMQELSNRISEARERRRLSEKPRRQNGT